MSGTPDSLPALDPEGVRDAVARVAIRTPLLPSPPLSERLDRPVLLKPENLQVTGSFKVRGAAARLAALNEEERSRGVVACSSGNHGRAVAHVAGRMNVPATICVPGWVDPVKREAMEAAGARVLLVGDSYDEAADEAARIRDDEGAVFVHPFDDLLVAAGQGTLALEIVEDAPDVATVVVPLSGGGLAGGVAHALKERRPGVEVVAATARRARVMLESLRAGEPVAMEEEETLASALAGGIDLDNRYTFRLIRGLVDRHVVVSEDEIADAVLWAFREPHLVVEGGGAVGLAALLAGRLTEGTPAGAGEDTAEGARENAVKDHGEAADATGDDPDDGPLVVVLSGGNVGLETLCGLQEGR